MNPPVHLVASLVAYLPADLFPPALWAAFALGFFGSFHCVGMCGPIALALSATGLAKWRFVAGRVLYNLGRVVTYTALGASIGAAEQVFDVHRYQETVSITLGVMILAVLLLPASQQAVLRRAASLPLVERVFSRLRSRISSVLQATSYRGQFALGVLNGFLPCGFVYMGLAGAVMMGNAVHSAEAMAMFGLGTIPAMLTLAIASSLASSFITQHLRASLRRLVPLGAAVMAVLFIMRGLSLGIPYISPKLSAQKTSLGCHPN